MQFVECRTSFQSIMTYRNPFVAKTKANALSEKFGVPFYTQQVGERHKICLDFKDVDIKVEDIGSGIVCEFV